MNGARWLKAMIITAAGLGLAPMAHAEQDVANGPGATASARLDFRIVIPRFLLFRVGSAGNTVDLVDFDLSTNPNLGDSTPIAATSGGSVPVQIRTNATGVITIGASTAGALTNGGTGSISFTEISTSSATIPAPTLADGASVDTTFTPGAGTVNDTWTYQYLNTGTPEEGTYGGVGVGTVTYTATLP